jgi:ribosomal protein S18 acetylase RimI-like enzyme
MSAADLDVACQVIGLAFADNPSTLATVRGDRAKARSTMERAMHIVKLGLSDNHALVAEQEGQLVGVLNAAQWPACQMGAWQKLRAAPAMLRALGTALPRASKMMSARARHDPGVAHWHIGPIGVHPGHQGRGIGKALLGSFLERVDEQGLPGFLETDVDRNVALYEKFGFTVISRQDILGIDTRFMWRAPFSGPCHQGQGELRAF